MARKTVKDLDEFRNVMTDVRRMVEETYKRYEDLEKWLLEKLMKMSQIVQFVV